MKFSIIVPVYNVEEYLDECIQSILSQSCTDFEILLINDGSTDQSGAICDRYALIDGARIRVFHQSNQGQMKARRNGVQHASGDVCLFVDADDCLRPDALQLLYDKMSAGGCDMLLFNASEYADFHKPYYTMPFRDGQCFTGAEKKTVYELLITTRKLNSLVTKAVRTELIRMAVDAYSDFSGTSGEDLLQSLLLVDRAETIAYTDQILYYYRQREGSTVHRFRPRMCSSIRFVNMELDKYIDRWGMQALRPKHYAKHVNGCMVCVSLLLRQTEACGRACVLHLRELAEDDYFRHAYAHMDAGVLSRQDTILSRWLYRKNYGCLMLAGWAMRLADKVRGLLKKSS